MPFIVERNTSLCPASKPWAVRNEESGDLRGCHASATKARGQQEALYANVPDASKPAKRKAPGMKWEPKARLRDFLLGRLS